MLHRKKRALKRDKQLFNFDTADTAVILFDTADPDVLSDMKSFRKFLSEKDIHNTAFGIVHEKKVPEQMLFWENFLFITRNDFNWYLMPKGETVDHFYRTKADILFDFTRSSSLELGFLVGLSPARFKIGCYTEAENDYDLMIRLQPEQSNSYLAEQIKHYVSMLNS